MNYLKYCYYKWKINKDENFLIEKGIKKAKENGLELKIGDELFKLNDSKGEISLPSLENGVDVIKLMALVADDYPEITKRYISNKEKIKNL